MTGRMEVDEGGDIPEEPSPGNTTPCSPLALPRRQRTTSASTDVSDAGGITPTRRNKRKMTAPKRRSDFSIKRFCPDLSDGRSADEEEEEDNEDGQESEVRADNETHRIRGECLDFSKRPRVLGGSTGSSPDSRRDSPPSSGEDCVTASRSVPGGQVGISMITPEGIPMHVVNVNSGVLGSHSDSRGALPHGMPHPYHHRLFAPPLHLQNPHNINLSNRIPTSTVTSQQQQQQHNSNNPGPSTSRMGLQILSQPPQITIPSESPSPGNFPIPSPPSPADSVSSMAESTVGGRKSRKNYKNMTRERRVEANARERSRVHTISAAFESLRRAVPSYSYNQKLSKLAILRIACSYILSLAKLADLDYSHEQSNYSFADCVEMCTRVIQTEGRARRRH